MKSRHRENIISPSHIMVVQEENEEGWVIMGDPLRICGCGSCRPPVNHTFLWVSCREKETAREIVIANLSFLVPSYRQPNQQRQILSKTRKR